MTYWIKNYLQVYLRCRTLQVDYPYPLVRKVKEVLKTFPDCEVGLGACNHKRTCVQPY